MDHRRLFSPAYDPFIDPCGVTGKYLSLQYEVSCFRRTSTAELDPVKVGAGWQFTSAVAKPFKDLVLVVVVSSTENFIAPAVVERDLIVFGFGDKLDVFDLPGGIEQVSIG